METKHSAVETGMNDNQLKIAQAMDAAGYEALWAKGKGGGFWVRGLGYMSLSKCAKLVGLKLTRKAA
jgi:hypothetical protein